MAERRTGTVRFFDVKKGWGFIRDTKENEDFFVHFTAINTPHEFKVLHENEMVTFEAGDAPRGPVAKNVTIINVKEAEKAFNDFLKNGVTSEEKREE